MKKIFLTLIGVMMLSIVTLAQSREQSEKANNPREKDDAVGKEEVARDTIEDPSKRPGPGVGVSESNESDDSKNDNDNTVTQKEKRNLPGNRSQADENETGKKTRRSEKDNP
ncbi:MAG TPA: hypothetical protein VFZ52_13245 [Chryseolinea sp.]